MLCITVGADVCAPSRNVTICHRELCLTLVDDPKRGKNMFVLGMLGSIYARDIDFRIDVPVQVTDRELVVMNGNEALGLGRLVRNGLPIAGLRTVTSRCPSCGLTAELVLYGDGKAACTACGSPARWTGRARGAAGLKGDGADRRSPLRSPAPGHSLD